MNWEAIGAVGEIVGAIAVFATLAYLAIQIRQNTGAVRAAALDSSIQAASAVRSHIYNNEELAELFVLGGKKPEELNEAESIRYRNLVTNIFWALWNLYSQSKYADLNHSAWESQKHVVVRILGSPGGEWYWKNYGREFDEDFVGEINSVIKNFES